MKPTQASDSLHLDDYFSASYAQARQRFRRAGQEIGWQAETLELAGMTPEGEQLSVDVLQSPGAQSAPTLWLSSGLHGVEGYCGSAIQLRLLDHWRRVRAVTGIRVLLTHALNPWGFAWSRRTDADNRDLNRNFVLAADGYCGAPRLYRRLDPWLNPRGVPSRPDCFTWQAVRLLARFGFSELQAAIASGQYDFPQGLFYGGAEPAPIHRMLAERLPAWLAGSRRVVHLDLHTGLGRKGAGTLLLDRKIHSSERADLVAWFGRGSIREVGDEDAFYQAHGSFGRWCHVHGGVDHYLYGCLDFGTYSPLRVLKALRHENQCHHGCSPQSAEVAAAKKKLEKIFCPTDGNWRAGVLRKAVSWTDKVIDGLQESR